jgi:hypothetical protein
MKTKCTTAVLVMLLTWLAGGAALIAGGGSTPVPDVTPSGTADTLVVAQKKEKDTAGSITHIKGHKIIKIDGDKVTFEYKENGVVKIVVLKTTDNTKVVEGEARSFVEGGVKCLKVGQVVAVEHKDGVILGISLAWKIGRPVRGIEVRLMSGPGGEVVKTAKTDEDGKVVFPGLAPGKYRLSLVDATERKPVIGAKPKDKKLDKKSDPQVKHEMKVQNDREMHKVSIEFKPGLFDRNNEPVRSLAPVEIVIGPMGGRITATITQDNPEPSGQGIKGTITFANTKSPPPKVKMSIYSHSERENGLHPTSFGTKPFFRSCQPRRVFLPDPRGLA